MADTTELNKTIEAAGTKMAVVEKQVQTIQQQIDDPKTRKKEKKRLSTALQSKKGELAELVLQSNAARKKLEGSTPRTVAAAQTTVETPVAPVASTSAAPAQAKPLPITPPKKQAPVETTRTPTLERKKEFALTLSGGCIELTCQRFKDDEAVFVKFSSLDHFVERENLGEVVTDLKRICLLLEAFVSQK